MLDGSTTSPTATCAACPAALARDSLTGLDDRRALFGALERAAQEASRGGEAWLLLLDLDGFKAVNDSLGHPAGDQLLRLVAKRLAGAVRAGDTLARLGGDEFGLLLRGAGREAALAVGTRAVDLLGRPFLLGGQAATVGASVGLVEIPRQARSAEQAMRYADLALYRAKAKGRGRVEPFTPELQAAAERRRALEGELRGALPLGQLRVLHQPLIHLADRRPVGFEALLRWNHPRRGELLPGEFFFAAERCGTMAEVGRWALFAACADAVRWPAGGDGTAAPRVAVNIAGCQFDSGGLPQLVATALHRVGLPAARLELEVTENGVQGRGEAALEQLAELRRMGVAIALDDFGTGQSSLALLRRFPYDRIKVDGGYLAGASADRRSAAILRAMVGLARDLGVRSTAEGIETEEQLRLATEAGCDEGQGWLLGRPERPEEAARRLSAAATP
jgi:diguanylate cyclase (GGDEF)-like protein